MFRRVPILILLGLLALVSPLSAAAQSDAAAVLGVVSDESGGAVPGVSVTLSNVATGIQSVVVTDGEGAYQFLNVKVGTYRLEAELQGFTTAVVSNIEVTVNARQRVDVALRVGSIGEIHRRVRDHAVRKPHVRVR